MFAAQVGALGEVQDQVPLGLEEMHSVGLPVMDLAEVVKDARDESAPPDTYYDIPLKNNP